MLLHSLGPPCSGRHGNLAVVMVSLFSPFALSPSSCSSSFSHTHPYTQTHRERELTIQYTEKLHAYIISLCPQSVNVRGLLLESIKYVLAISAVLHCHRQVIEIKGSDACRAGVRFKAAFFLLKTQILGPVSSVAVGLIDG